MYIVLHPTTHTTNNVQRREKCSDGKISFSPMELKNGRLKQSGGERGVPGAGSQWVRQQGASQAGGQAPSPWKVVGLQPSR